MFITKQRQQEAARAAQAGRVQTLSQQQQHIGAHRPSLCDSDADGASSLQGSSLAASAAGVADMLLAGSSAAAAANAAAVAADAAAAASAGEGAHWAKGGWAMEFDLSGVGGADATEDEAVVTARGIAGNFRAVHRAAKALGGVPEVCGLGWLLEAGLCSHQSHQAMSLFAAPSINQHARQTLAGACRRCCRPRTLLSTGLMNARSSCTWPSSAAACWSAARTTAQHTSSSARGGSARPRRRVRACGCLQQRGSLALPGTTCSGLCC